MRLLSLLIVVFYSLSSFAGITAAQRYLATIPVAAAGGFTSTQSLSFNGSTGCVYDTVNQTGQDFSANMSFNVWMKNATYNGAGANDWTLVDKSFVARPGYWMSYGTTNHVASWFLLTSGNYTAYNSSVNTFDGAWHMITFVWDGSQGGPTTRLKIYIDGVADTSKTAITAGGNTTIGSSGTPLTVGCRDNGASFPANLGGWYTGKLSNLSIWNIALNATQVGQLASGGKPTDLSALSFWSNNKGWYYLGDGDATGANNIVDHSGNGYHMTIHGGVTVVADAP